MRFDDRVTGDLRTYAKSARKIHIEIDRSEINKNVKVDAALGAKFAKPDSEVWVVVGDGGFQMTMSELATIVQEKINIKIAIINNGFLGMVRQWQEFFYDKRYVATPLVAPDFAALANAFGIRGERITSRADVT